MKTKPDDITLTQWMDEELDGEPLRRVEAWAQEHPELLAERDAIQTMNASIRAHVPDSIEPPYPDFFNQRILRAIEEDQLAAAAPQATKNRKKSRGVWQWLSLPIAAGAMALCFYLGTQVSGESPNQAPPVLVNTSDHTPSVYTPDGTVRADIFKTPDAKAVVILLEGLEDIPDDLEIAGEPSTSPLAGSMMIKNEESVITF